MKKFLTLLVLCSATSSFVMASESTPESSEPSETADTRPPRQDDFNNPQSLSSKLSASLSCLREAVAYLQDTINYFEYASKTPGVTEEQKNKIRKKIDGLKTDQRLLNQKLKNWDKEWRYEFPESAKEYDYYWDLYYNNPEEWARRYPQDTWNG